METNEGYLVAIHKVNSACFYLKFYDFPECVVYGDSPSSVIRDCPHVLNTHLIEMQIDQLPIPAPQEHPRDLNARDHFYVRPPASEAIENGSPYPHNVEMNQINFQFKDSLEAWTWFKRNLEEDGWEKEYKNLSVVVTNTYDGDALSMLFYTQNKFYELREASPSAPFRKEFSISEYLGRELTSLNLTELLRDTDTPWRDIAWTHLACYCPLNRITPDNPIYTLDLLPWTAEQEKRFEEQHGI